MISYLIISDTNPTSRYTDQLYVTQECLKSKSYPSFYVRFPIFWHKVLINRVAHYGELSPECVHTYYRYGCALLYKAQEEADPLADVPKKEDGSQHVSNKDESVKSSMNAESSTASLSSNVELDVNSNDQESEVVNGQYVVYMLFAYLLFITRFICS